MTKRLGLKFLVGAALLVSVQVANAQIAGQNPPLAPTAITAFKADPSQLLSQIPNGGPALRKQIADLIASDKDTLAAIIALAKTANEDQRTAIAQGLADGAKAYASGNDPAFGGDIQRTVVQAGLPELARAYAEAAGDTSTAAAGGGGGGGGAGGGGGPTTAGSTTGGSNSGNAINGSNFAANQSSGLTTGGSLSGANASQVSPF
ncbi:hypothetical protein [uncultured Bradyrhizobium sp.]|jgi:hypothetical protein|uniref:hypothetical protein n=1 Tax=uncultured Bradyrhizobium sp. TaxID=199684 RepID=UPI002609F49D|nr:hypothetical protein [uncultured Bradyrhizobium sp.]